MSDQLYEETKAIMEELIEASKLKAGDIVVVGCSSSEIKGENIGSASSPEIGEQVFKACYDVTKAHELNLACQCCEHLNRAIVCERKAQPEASEVNVVPQPNAGGSFSTAAYKHFEEPIVLENILAQAGLDIGNTFIGMHIEPVCVPLRLDHHRIGEAWVNACRRRPKSIGGERAHYNMDLK